MGGGGGHVPGAGGAVVVVVAGAAVVVIVVDAAGVEVLDVDAATGSVGSCPPPQPATTRHAAVRPWRTPG